MHLGSALSPLLFVIVMVAISREFRVALLWKLLNEDHMVVIAKTKMIKLRSTSVDIGASANLEWISLANLF